MPDAAPGASSPRYGWGTGMGWGCGAEGGEGMGQEGAEPALTPSP